MVSIDVKTEAGIAAAVNLPYANASSYGQLDHPQRTYGAGAAVGAGEASGTNALRPGQIERKEEDYQGLQRLPRAVAAPGRASHAGTVPRVALAPVAEIAVAGGRQC